MGGPKWVAGRLPLCERAAVSHKRRFASISWRPAASRSADFFVRTDGRFAQFFPSIEPLEPRMEWMETRIESLKGRVEGWSFRMEPLGSSIVRNDSRFAQFCRRSTLLSCQVGLWTPASYDSPVDLCETAAEWETFGFPRASGGEELCEAAVRLHSGKVPADSPGWITSFAAADVKGPRPWERRRPRWHLPPDDAVSRSALSRRHGRYRDGASADSEAPRSRSGATGHRL